MTVRLSPERIAQARALRESGIPWEEIGDRLGCSKYTLKSVLVEGWRDRRNECTRINRRVKRGTPGARPLRMAIKNDRCGEFATRAPDDVLADRERRAMLEPHSLTAALLGDPLPGRSALDQRKPRLLPANVAGGVLCMEPGTYPGKLVQAAGRSRLPRVVVSND